MSGARVREHGTNGSPDGRTTAGSGHRPHGAADDLISIGFATTITVLAIVYVVAPSIALLLAWEAVAIG